MDGKFPLTAVVFDMDGLLLDSERRSQEVLSLAASELGVSISPEALLGMVGKNNVEGPRYLQSHIGDGSIVNKLLLRFMEIYSADVEMGRIPLKKGVMELLDTLDELRVPRAIATSTVTDLAKRKLVRLGILSRFAAVIGGDQVRHGKPAPDIYLKACAALGQEPTTTLACEDSGPGIEAAASAGLRAVLVPDLIAPTELMLSHAWRVVESLHDIIGIIRNEARVSVSP